MVEAETRAGAFAGGTFPTGTALSRSLSLLAGNLVLFTALAGLATAPEYLIAITSDDAGVAADSPVGAVLRSFWPGPVVTTITTTLSTAIIVYLVLHQVTRQPVRVGDAFAAAIARFPSLASLSLISLVALIGMPLIAVVLLTGFPVFTLNLSTDEASFLGLISVVPGFVLLGFWYVATPVCVMERCGVFQSLRRSRALTNGARAKLVALVILQLALSYMSGILATDGAGSFVGYWGQTAVQFVLSNLLSAFWAVLVGVAYHELCMEKQGFGSEGVAAVFD